MFLRCHLRKKDGKQHRYCSVEESRRWQSGRVVQRRVLYLGEINDRRVSGLAQDAGRVRRTAAAGDDAESVFGRSASSSRCPRYDPGQTEPDAVAAGAAVRQLLVGLRVVAATGTGPVLGAETAAWPRRRRLVASAGVAGGEPADRSRQRVSCASPMGAIKARWMYCWALISR